MTVPTPIDPWSEPPADPELARIWRRLSRLSDAERARVRDRLMAIEGLRTMPFRRKVKHVHRAIAAVRAEREA